MNENSFDEKADSIFYFRTPFRLRHHFQNLHCTDLQDLPEQIKWNFGILSGVIRSSVGKGIDFMVKDCGW
jgi:hypothetical protein